MPSTYAHRRIGGDVKNGLPQDIMRLIEDNYDFYALGLHGPDLLFYYKPLKSNKINAEGYAMHDRYASEFFSRAEDIYRKRSKREHDAAYLFGFLCHFALDSESHPYVNEKIAQSGITHTEIESNFDRFLMLKDGLKPFGFDVTSHIVPDERLCDTAAAYFIIEENQAEKSINSLKFYNRLLTTRKRLIRSAGKLILKLSGNYKEMHGMFLPDKEDPRCADSNRILYECYGKAVKKAVRLIENYSLFLECTENLSAELDRNFE
ncbi:MAG: zinc dependent phospholipase C family protein [Candidatus Coproplasma sp.]